MPKDKFEEAFQDRAVMPSTTQILGRKAMPSFGVRDADALWLGGHLERRTVKACCDVIRIKCCAALRA